MNYCCEAEFEEYEGQFNKDIFGAYEGCRCIHCQNLREEPKMKKQSKKRKFSKKVDDSKIFDKPLPDTIKEIGKEIGLPQSAIDNVLKPRKTKYKKGRELTNADLKKYQWGNILWVDVSVNKGDGFKLRISEPAVITRSDDGNYICMSVHDNGCDDICIRTTDYEDGRCLFYSKDEIPESRYEFYEAHKI